MTTSAVFQLGRVGTEEEGWDRGNGGGRTGEEGQGRGDGEGDR